MRNVSQFALVLRNFETTCTLLFLGKRSSFKMDNRTFSPIVTDIANILETDKVQAQHLPSHNKCMWAFLLAPTYMISSSTWTCVLFFQVTILFFSKESRLFSGLLKSSCHLLLREREREFTSLTWKYFRLHCKKPFALIDRYKCGLLT